MSAFRNIMAAEFIRYNANAAGRSTGDCVKRALSLAFDIPYNEMSKELIAKMKELHKDHWNTTNVYEKVIQAHGGSAEIKVPDPTMKLHEFADTIGKEGTWLVVTGPKPDKAANHIVCIIDGTIYDSWDSTDEYALRYHTVDNAPARNFTEINIVDYRADIEQEVGDVGAKLVTKYPWYEYLRLFDADFVQYKDNKYKAKIDMVLSLKPRPYHDRSSSYTFNFSIVFTPSTTDEEAHKIIKQTVQTRLYDRLYSINQQEKKLEEAHQAGGAELRGWHDAREMRFYHSLPGKYQGIITDVSIERPGWYSDSYTVRVRPQHGENEDYIRLTAIDAAEMKELIEFYVETGETYLPY